MSNAQPEQAELLELSPKEARFVRAYMESGDQTEAARAAGCKAKTDGALRQAGYRLRRRLDGPIRALMVEAGLDALSLLRDLKMGLRAERVNVSFDRDGNAHAYDSPDWPSRARYLDMAIRLRGGYPKQQLELDFTQRPRELPANELASRLAQLRARVEAAKAVTNG